MRRAIFAAFPDRVAKRREGEPRRARLASGRGLRLAPTSAVVEGDLFVAVEIEGDGRGARSESIVHQASSIDPSWLDPESLETSTEVRFDEESGKVVARRSTRYGELVLEQASVPLPDDGEVESILVEAAAARPDPLALFASDELRAFLIRARCLAAWMPELDLPPLDDDWLRSLLPDLAIGCRSLADLARAPALGVAKTRLGRDKLADIDRHAPETIQVPSGSRIRVAYAEGQPPVLAVRIQEMFGQESTPRIAGGRVALLLHLLAPNMRPQQVTDDLESFWRSAYLEVRKELRRRYPKHAWPEDPRQAPAERRPGRKNPRR